MKLRLLYVKEAKGDLASSPSEVCRLMKAEAQADRECFWVLHLNTKLQIIEKELVAMGALDQAVVHPREVFRKAVINSTAKIITVHNHPSGSTELSPEDLSTWQKLKAAGEILAIEVIDNIIISKEGYSSQKERGKN
jgi:DNA repair protein RadC